MIIKEIENSIIFSIKKNQSNELVILLHKKELKDFLAKNGKVMRIGLNKEQRIEILVAFPDMDNIVSYILPKEEKITNLINFYNLKHVFLGYAEEKNVKDVNLLFEGFLKII